MNCFFNYQLFFSKMPLLTAEQNLERVFAFVKSLESVLGVERMSIVNVDVMKNPHSQSKAFEEACDILKKQTDNKGLVAMTTLPADSRDGPNVTNVVKEWLFVPSYDVMFYFLTDGRMKVTGDSAKITELTQKLGTPVGPKRS